MLEFQEDIILDLLCLEIKYLINLITTNILMKNVLTIIYNGYKAWNVI